MSSRSAVKIYPSSLEAPGAIQPQRLCQPGAKEIDNFLGSIRVAENTKRSYRRALYLFAAWSGYSAPSSSADAQAFLEYRESLGRKPATLAVDAYALTRYLRWKGIDVGRLERPNVTLPAPEYLSRQEIQVLLEAAESPLLQCIVAVLYDSGARIREILGVAMDGVDPEGFLQVRRKGGRADTAIITDWAKQYLDSWLEVRGSRHPMLFLDYKYESVRRWLKKAAIKGGIKKFHPHMLRHSRAVHLREEGMEWEDIGYLLGHVDVRTTINIYGRPTAQDLRQRVPKPKL